MPAFTWIPDANPQRQAQSRRRAVEFGGGYSQRSGDGVNLIRDTWRLGFSNRTIAEITAIDTFLRQQAGIAAFDWTDPTGATRKYTCENWNASFSYDLDCSLTADFKQEFGG